MSEERTAQRLLEHEELRDIHQRIDALKQEGERNHRELTDKLHGLEVAVARGARFPAGAWVAAFGIVVSVVGTGAVLYSELQHAASTATKSLSLIEQHTEGSSARFQNIEHFNAVARRWEGALPVLEERVRVLEGRIVGLGPNGWHRSDHEEYAKRIDAEMARVQQRLDALEGRRK